MSALPWFNTEEGIQRFTEIWVLVWIWHWRHTHSYWESPGDIPFTKTVRGAPAPLKNSVIALLCRPELTVETAVTELGILNAVGVFRSPDGRSQVAAHNHQGKVGLVTGMERRVKAPIRAGWLGQLYGFIQLLMIFLEVKELGSPVSSYLICRSRDVTGQMNKTLFWITKTESCRPLINSQTWAIKTLRRKCRGTFLWCWISEMDS